MTVTQKPASIPTDPSHQLPLGDDGQLETGIDHELEAAHGISLPTAGVGLREPMLDEREPTVDELVAIETGSFGDDRYMSV